MHRVVSLTPAHWVKKELEGETREKVSAWIVTSISQEDVHWESDWGADRSWQGERGQQSRIDWLLLGDWGQGWRIEACFLRGCEQHGKVLRHWKTNRHCGRKHLVAPQILSWCHLTLLPFLPFPLSSMATAASLAEIQGASPVAKTHFSTTLGHPTTTPNKSNSSPKKRVRQRGRKDG